MLGSSVVGPDLDTCLDSPMASSSSLVTALLLQASLGPNSPLPSQLHPDPASLQALSPGISPQIKNAHLLWESQSHDICPGNCILDSNYFSSIPEPTPDSAVN